MADLLTPKEAAERLRICPRTLLEHVKAMELDAIHIGHGRLRRRLRFDPADLEAFNERRKAEARELIGEQSCRSTSTKKRPSTTTTSSTRVIGFMKLRERL
jgi:excisionase family DNA binding protein